MTLTTSSQVWKIIASIAFLITVVFAILFYFSDIFLTFIIGVILILVTERIAQYYNERIEKFHLKRYQKKALAGLLFLFWFCVGAYFTTTSLLELRDVISSSNHGLSIVESIRPLLPTMTPEATMEWLFAGQEYILGLFTTLFSNLSVIVVNGLLIIPLMFYMYFRRGKEFQQKALDVIPQKFHAAGTRAYTSIAKDLHGFFEAKVLESVIIGIICSIGFFAAGLSGWLLLAVFAGILNIVPYIGPIIGAVPAVVIACLHDPTTATLVVATILVAQLIDNFYLIPFMINTRVQIEPLLGIILVLVGSRLLGVLGMVMAIPIYIIYKVILTQTYSELVKVYDK